MSGPALADVTSLLASMVKIHSVNASVTGKKDAEAEMGQFLERELTLRGMKVRRLKTPGCDNLLATYEVNPTLPWLVFESHMDTVTLEGMTIDPLAAKLEGGRLWGRGSCDTKGTAAAMIVAISRYMQSKTQPYNIAMACTVDEEYGMTGVRALVNDWPSLGINAVGFIVGEPTNLLPIVAHNGSVRWNIITHGKAAHSSNPALGQSAISDMVRVIDTIESQYIPSLDKRDELTGKAQCSVNMIQGGVQYNIIPERCEIRIDRRVVPGEDQKAVMPAVEVHLQKLKKAQPQLKYEQELNFACPPLTRQNNQALVSHVCKVLAKMGWPNEAQGVPFCTDAGDLDEAGLPCVVIGPGDIAQAHTKDEWIDLQQLERGVDVYLALMLEPWAG